MTMLTWGWGQNPVVPAKSAPTADGTALIGSVASVGSAGVAGSVATVGRAGVAGSVATVGRAGVAGSFLTLFCMRAEGAWAAADAWAAPTVSGASAVSVVRECAMWLAPATCANTQSFGYGRLVVEGRADVGGPRAACGRRG